MLYYSKALRQIHARFFFKRGLNRLELDFPISITAQTALPSPGTMGTLASVSDCRPVWVQERKTRQQKYNLQCFNSW